MSDLQPASEQEPTGPSAIALLRPIVLHSLWRFRWVLALGFVAGVAFGVFRGLVMPNQFRSTGKLMVRPGALEAMSPESVLSGGALVTRSGGSREAVQNVLQALTAPDYYERIVRRLGVGTIMAPYDPGRDDGSAWYKQVFHAFQSWWFNEGDGAPTVGGPGAERSEKIAALVLQNSLWLVPEAGTSVISVHYVSHSPELAKQVVDASLEEARAWYSEMAQEMTSPKESEAMRLQAEEAASAAEAKLRSFRNEKGVNEYESDHKRLVGDLAEYEKQLKSLAIEADRVGAALATQAKYLATVSPRLVRSPQLVDNPDYARESARLVELQKQLFDIEREEGSSEQKRVRREPLQKEIEKVRDLLAKLSPKVLGPAVEDDNPAYARGVEEIGKLQVELDGAKAARAATERVCADTRTRLSELEAMAPELRKLEEASRFLRREADNLGATQSAKSAMKRFEAANLSSVFPMQLGTMDGIRIAPRRGQLVVVGAVGGLAVAAGLIVLLALLDRRVRYREDLPRLGVPDAGVVVSGTGGSGMPWMLPSSLAEIRDDIARFWAKLPYERRQAEGLRIGFVPCGEGASAGRAAAALAIGLAAHGGEKVCYVGTLEGPTWLGQRLGLDHQCGWSEVLRGEFQLEDAVVATPVKGLSYLPAGRIGPVVPHPMAGPEFVALLDRLVRAHRFVIVELPDVGLRPEGRSVLGVMDGAHVVVQRGIGSKASVRDAIEAVRTAGARLLGGVLQPPAIAGTAAPRIEA